MPRMIWRGTLYLFGRFAWTQRRDVQANSPAMCLASRLNTGVAGRYPSQAARALGSTSPWLGGRVMAGGEGPLDPGDVVPAAMLPADTLVDPDKLKPHSAVQADACLVGQRHTRDGGAVPALG
jgi:hypothetical protein